MGDVVREFGFRVSTDDGVIGVISAAAVRLVGRRDGVDCAQSDWFVLSVDLSVVGGGR